MSVFVLWEDKAISPIVKFGPHLFLIACVARRLNTDRHQLKRSERIDGKSCAGNANVFRELQRGALWDSGVHVVAVLDTDELHDRLPGIQARRMVADTDYERWSATAVAEIRQRAPGDAQARLQICFLDRNLETLLSLVGRGTHELDDALGKSPLHRDKLLHRAAADEDLVARACAEIPSWNHLVTTVAELLQ